MIRQIYHRATVINNSNQVLVSSLCSKEPPKGSKIENKTLQWRSVKVKQQKSEILIISDFGFLGFRSLLHVIIRLLSVVIGFCNWLSFGQFNLNKQQNFI